MALDAYEYAARTNGTSGRRHRIEHVEVPRLSDLARFEQLGAIASQAMFATPGAPLLRNDMKVSQAHALLTVMGGRDTWRDPAF